MVGGNIYIFFPDLGFVQHKYICQIWYESCLMSAMNTFDKVEINQENDSPLWECALNVHNWSIKRWCAYAYGAVGLILCKVQ